MNRLIEARSTSDLPRINEVIHDEWFWVHDVAFEKGESRVRTTFQSLAWGQARPSWSLLFLQGIAVPRVRWRLEICNATELVLRETERVGRYDFNSVAYDPATSVVKVLTGIPLQFEIKVSALLIRLEDTGETAEEETRIRLARFGKREI